MPDSPTSQPESDFVCDCDPWNRSACAGEPFYGEHSGKRYCLLHFPGKEKGADFKAALQRKLENKDFDFSGVWFPDYWELVSPEEEFPNFHFTAKADFKNATFSAGVSFYAVSFDSSATFIFATFNGEGNFSYSTFRESPDFEHATFRGKADFSDAIFCENADFKRVTFWEKADFSDATFRGDADFMIATFTGEAVFTQAAFSSEVDFHRSSFSDYLRLSGGQDNQIFKETRFLNFHFVSIDQPERVSFHTACLHPHWFIDVDARKFEFVNVHWNNSGRSKPEIELLKRNKVAAPHRLLAIACRKLAANAEDNNRYREASHFRRMAFDAERLETWHGFDVRRLNWWYWIASGYGERPFQALLVLIGILVLFGLLYTQVGFARWEPRLASEADVATAKRDDVGAPLKFSRGLTYSAGVLTFQRPEPKPVTTAAQTLVLLETILGPVQAALLALAIRRKFMR